METIKPLLQNLNCFSKRSTGSNTNTRKQEKLTQTNQSPDIAAVATDTSGNDDQDFLPWLYHARYVCGSSQTLFSADRKMNIQQHLSFSCVEKRTPSQKPPQKYTRKGKQSHTTFPGSHRSPHTTYDIIVIPTSSTASMTSISRL